MAHGKKPDKVDEAIAAQAAAEQREPLRGQVLLQGGRAATFELPNPLFAQDIVRIGVAMSEIWKGMPLEELPGGGKPATPSVLSRLTLPGRGN